MSQLFTVFAMGGGLFLVAGAAAWIGDRLPQTPATIDFEGDEDL